MRTVLSISIVLALGYGALLLLVYAFQDRLIYFPFHGLATTPRALGLDYEDVRLTTEDGVRLHAWFVPAPAARATVLHLHGNGGNISHRLDRIAAFRELGLNAFLIDYRGYGLSEGRPSEDGTYRDAAAAWHYLTEARGVADASIVIHGESLGGAVASWLAARTHPAALIVESSFTSAVDLGAEVYPWLPVRRLARFRYPTAAYLARVRAPTLIVHSRDDEIVPFRHGEALYAAAAEPKRLLAIGGDHNAGYLLSRAEYLAGVDAFLAEALGRMREQVLHR
ncbi:MAG TPA: alpha/beta hydrolase [Burkholderiales bacterium]